MIVWWRSLLKKLSDLLLLLRRYGTFFREQPIQTYMIQATLRRFRKEIRERDDIQPEATIVLSNNPARSANTKAAQLLLRDVFKEHITIEFSENGLLCGSREEAAIYRLQQYTRAGVTTPDVLLCSLPLAELTQYLAARGVDEELFLPTSPEQRFVQELGEQFPDVLYGL